MTKETKRLLKFSSLFTILLGGLIFILNNFGWISIETSEYRVLVISFFFFTLGYTYVMREYLR